ncbi:uncharacterized protein LY89DRAFT_733632 [Mollisia scopiformis]|uniref:Uncharacterized protein n=1 Tax=Mollisia scopiformis TaxID=149040 RepID=A0A194XCB7_MOLSC|nr:uncharacterized protein LY89DRAFT_733632 [Mollisia scopiformis]KUJ17810.1 hypothetical protein LY89DRAFT_733632 [Mollisia scopiformis]
MFKAPLSITFLALLTTVFASIFTEDLTNALLKRQEPGTPAYDCHLNCGTAITISRSATDPCTNSTFLSDYDACLDCAGPDNQNIWQYYGTALSIVATKCGLSTTPVANATTSGSVNGTVSSTGSASGSTASPPSTSSMSLSASSTASGVTNGTASSTPVVAGTGTMMDVGTFMLFALAGAVSASCAF